MKKAAGLLFIVLAGARLGIAAELPNFYIHTGISRPVTPAEFKDNYRTGVNVGVAVGKQLMNFLEGDFYLVYHGTTFDPNNYRSTFDPDTRDLYSIEGGSTHTLGAMIRARWIMPSPEESRVQSYVYLGGGLVHHSTGDVDVLGPAVDGSQDFSEPGGSDTVPGLCGGIGFEYHVESTVLFLELGVFSAFTEGDATMLLPLKFGIAIK